MGRSRSGSRSKRSRSRRRHRSRSRLRGRSIDRDKSRDRERSRSKDRDRKRHKRSYRRRSYSRSISPPSRRRDSPPANPNIEVSSPLAGNAALSSLLLGTNQTGDSSLVGVTLPDDVKKDLCVKDWDPNKMTGAALRWVSEQVAEQISARTKELDEVVRDRVSKAKIELEGRLRAQIEQEWKDEMDAVRRREQESLNRVKVMEKSLEDKLREVEEEKLKLNDERLKMLEVKSKLEMEKNTLKEELEQLKKQDQHSVLNKGGFQRDKIRLSFGRK